LGVSNTQKAHTINRHESSELFEVLESLRILFLKNVCLASCLVSFRILREKVDAFIKYPYCLILLAYPVIGDAFDNTANSGLRAI
jgi:hypothetical protein